LLGLFDVSYAFQDCQINTLEISNKPNKI